MKKFIQKIMLGLLVVCGAMQGVSAAEVLMTPAQLHDTEEKHMADDYLQSFKFVFIDALKTQRVFTLEKKTWKFDATAFNIFCSPTTENGAYKIFNHWVAKVSKYNDRNKKTISKIIASQGLRAILATIIVGWHKEMKNQNQIKQTMSTLMGNIKTSHQCDSTDFLNNLDTLYFKGKLFPKSVWTLWLGNDEKFAKYSIHNALDAKDPECLEAEKAQRSLAIFKFPQGSRRFATSLGLGAAIHAFDRYCQCLSATQLSATQQCSIGQDPLLYIAVYSMFCEVMITLARKLFFESLTS